MGHEAIILPMMEAIHSPEAALEALASRHSDIAITSAEAIRALTSIKTEMSQHLNTPIFCVGAATADAARQFGFDSIGIGNGTGRALGQIVADTYHAVGSSGNLVYLAGQPRSPGFETTLRQEGVNCIVAEVYRMSPIVYAPAEIEALFESCRPDAVLFYSHETVRHFFRLIAPEKLTAFPDIRLLCLSDHVAAAVPRGIGKVSVAALPAEDNLLVLL